MDDTYWLQPESRRHRITKQLKSAPRLPIYLSLLCACLSFAIIVLLYQTTGYLPSTALFTRQHKSYGIQAVCHENDDDKCEQSTKNKHLFIAFTVTLGLICVQLLVTLGTLLGHILVSIAGVLVSALSTAAGVVSIMVTLHPLRKKNEDKMLGYTLCWVMVGGCGLCLAGHAAALGIYYYLRQKSRRVNSSNDGENTLMSNDDYEGYSISTNSTNTRGGKNCYSYTNQTIGFEYKN